MTGNFLAELFRRNLRALRVRAKLSQSDLARRMDRNPSYICDLERGRRDPTLPTLALLADALGSDPSDLLRPTLRFVSDDEAESEDERKSG